MRIYYHLSLPHTVDQWVGPQSLSPPARELKINREIKPYKAMHLYVLILIENKIIYM